MKFWLFLKRNWLKVLKFLGIVMVLILIYVGWNHFFGRHPSPSFKPEVAATDRLGVRTMASRLEDLQKTIDDLKSRPPMIVTQVVQTTQVVTQSVQVPMQPNSVVMLTTNSSVSNSTPVSTIECKGFGGGQTVGIFGNSNIVINGSVTIYPNRVVVPTPVTKQDQQQPRQQQVALSWPYDSEPTRIIRVKGCLLSSGVSSFSLPTEIIRAGEDIGILIPDGWAVNAHTSANDPNLIEAAVDGKIKQSVPGRVFIPPTDSVQHHEMRFRLRGGVLEASLDLLFYKL